MFPIVFVCKYRKPLLAKLGDKIKKTFEVIASNSDFDILEMEVDKDHIHLLVRTEPKVSVLQTVRKLKQISTNRIWAEECGFLKKHFWKERTFWSDGYFACTVGNVSHETVKKYIQTQG